MEKIISKLFGGAFIAILIRSFLVGPDISDAMVLISLIVGLVSVMFIEKNKLALESQLDSKLNLMGSQLQSKIDELNNKVSAIHLKQGINRISLNEIQKR